jgi:nitroreductase
MISKTDLNETILKSQHCQRNWDLSKEIPQEDIDLIITAATQCPSKQNVAYYNIHAVTNRDIIEAIHANTDGFTIQQNPYKSTTNTQVLANLLIVLEPIDIDVTSRQDALRNDQTIALADGTMTDIAEIILERDKNIAVGIASGYVNLTSTLLGYYTGYCACFSRDKVREILNLKNEAVLLLGIGFKDNSLDRKIQHTNHRYVYPAKRKQEINVSYWK